MKKNYLFTTAFLFLFGFTANLHAQCVTNLGGDVDPVFLTFSIGETTLAHDTFFQQPLFYNEYPQAGSTTATLAAGQEYQIYTATSSEAVIGLWVDYNQNNDFEESEFTLLVNSMTTQNTTSFVVSPNAVVGNTKIRLRTRAFGSTITALNACTSFGSGETRDYTVEMAPALSAAQFAKNDQLKVYPNPATNIVTAGTAENIKSVALYGISGNLIATNNSNTLDVSAYASGIYMVKATHVNGQISYGKVVKQ